MVHFLCGECFAVLAGEPGARRPSREWHGWQTIRCTACGGPGVTAAEIETSDAAYAAYLAGLAQKARSAWGRYPAHVGVPPIRARHGSDEGYAGGRFVGRDDTGPDMFAGTTGEGVDR